MGVNVPVRCQCGAVRGVARDVSPGAVNRVVCSCKFCQSYARHLGQDAQILDEFQGTEVVQLSPAAFEITEGHDQLACLTLTKSGALRWYAACCQTPLGNTLRHGRIPFLGVVRVCLGEPASGPSLDEAVGPIRARVNGSYPPDRQAELKATRWALVTMLAHFGALMLWWRARGDHRKHPFFDPKTGAPIREPVRVRIGDSPA
jgi:hypothetical protein